jgi:hypothetical protein
MAALILLAVVGIGGCRTAQVVEVVVPLGTQARLDRGGAVVVMPALLEFHVGDTLRIRNDDVVEQTVGPYVVPAGEVLEMRYGAPGDYEGWCPLSDGETYRIVVTE